MTEDHRQIQLIMSLRSHGIRDTRVLEAIEKAPRELFIDPRFADQAYADQALPISCGQTISQPYVVALMTEKLDLTDRHKVLEVGTGSGYQTAILAHLCRRVYTIERYRTLAKAAQERFDKLKLSNITAIAGDGTKGWPAQAPFERIIVTAAAKDIPQALLDQLADGGIMIIPVDVSPGHQELVRVTRKGDAFEREELLAVRFVPLVEGVAKEM